MQAYVCSSAAADCLCLRRGAISSGSGFKLALFVLKDDSRPSLHLARGGNAEIVLCLRDKPVESFERLCDI